MKNLTSISMKRFKRIDEAEFDLADITVLVGSNNSGKSSIIQGIHFLIATLQSIRLAGRWPNKTKKTSLSVSLTPGQLIYSPSDDVHSLGYGGKLQAKEGTEIQFEFFFDDGKKTRVDLAKGKNQNIVVAVDDIEVAASLSRIDTPYTVFSPGLAGITRAEAYVSDGVLLRALARGDANLYLRNTLLRLSRENRWSDFTSDLQNLYPDIELDVKFDESVDEYITVSSRRDNRVIPLELAGTGLLQAAQILSYIHYFQPQMVVLDEPDSHLHPNNQRLICALLEEVVSRGDTQVMLTTHSRHVVDSLGGLANFLWVQNGVVNPAGADDEVSILMDIGALDVREKLAGRDYKIVVLTEDRLLRPIKLVLQASGFDRDETLILSYHGVSNPRNMAPVFKNIVELNPSAKVVVHRDKDFLNEVEVKSWEEEIRKLGAQPFVTKEMDIEAYFLNGEYLSSNNEPTDGEFEQIILESLGEVQEQLIAKYVNARVEILRTQGQYKIDFGKLSVEATKAITESPGSYLPGKLVQKIVRRKYREAYGSNLSDTKPSHLLADERLAAIAKKVFKGKKAD